MGRLGVNIFTGMRLSVRVLKQFRHNRGQARLVLSEADEAVLQPSLRAPKGRSNPVFEIVCPPITMRGRRASVPLALLGVPRNDNCRTATGGQALVELAVFGAVLLFVFGLLLRYGMNTMYEQNVRMQTFRKAFARASSYDATSDPATSSYTTDITPDWTYEVSPSASQNTGRAGQLPFVSNHSRTVSYTVVEDKPVLSASAILPIAERSPISATTEAVRSIDMFAAYADKDHPTPNPQDLPRLEYEINTVRYEGGQRKDTDEHRYSFTTAAFKTYTGSAEVGDSKDVDVDGKDEYIVYKSGDNLLVLDYQEGELDLEDDDGLQSDYNKRAQVNNSTLSRSEGTKSVITGDRINADETINRVIKTRSGDTNVSDTFSTQRTEIWHTPHKK